MLLCGSLLNTRLQGDTATTARFLCHLATNCLDFSRALSRLLVNKVYGVLCEASLEVAGILFVAIGHKFIVRC